MRRTKSLLACGLLLVGAALTSAGCSDAAEERTLVVLGPWIDGEEKHFRDTLDKIEKDTRYEYVYKGTHSLRETLVAQLQAGDPPDLAILNSPGDLVEYAKAGEIHSLPENVVGAAVPPWAPRITVEDADGVARSHAFWAPVRVDLKSLAWSRRASGKKARDWCLGMSSGATTGWPGTDWIEDLILQRLGPDDYETWATGGLKWEETRGAWEEWGTLIAKNPTVPGEKGLGQEGLDQSFERLPEGGGFGLLNSGRCTHEHQGSFIRRHYDETVLPTPTARLLGPAPASWGTLEPVDWGEVYEVSGDMAAVFKPSAAAWALLKQLTGREARDHWADAARDKRPYFPGGTYGRKVEANAPTQAVQKLFDEADEICMDASDAMPPTLRDAFYRAVLEFLEAPKDTSVLTRLLQELEAERVLQEKERAFLLDDLCGRPPDGPR